MTLLNCEGFDNIVKPWEVGSDYADDFTDYLRNIFDLTYYGETHKPRPNYGWCGGHALEPSPDAYGDYIILFLPFNESFNDDTITFTVGCRVKTRNASSGWTLMGFRGLTDYQCYLKMESDNTISFYCGATKLNQTTSAVYSLNSWHFIELSTQIGSSASYEIFVDGTSVLSGTGDTAALSSNIVDEAYFSCPKLYGTTYPEIFLLDDVYVLNSKGTKNNSRLGPVKVFRQRPMEVGADDNWAITGGKENKVESVGLPFDDNTGLTGTGKQGFKLNPLSVSNIKAVQLRCGFRVTEPKEVSLTPFIKSASTTEVGNEAPVVADSTIWTTDMYETDPDGGLDWDTDGFNAAEFGGEV